MMPMQQQQMPMNPAMMQQPSPFVHPRNMKGRQAEDIATSRLSKLLAGPVQPHELDQLAERMDPMQLRQLLFALQGVPGSVAPVRGD